MIHENLNVLATQNIATPFVFSSPCLKMSINGIKLHINICEWFAYMFKYMI